MDFINRIFKIFTVAIMPLIILSGCAENNEYLEQQRLELQAEIRELEAEKESIKEEIVSEKEENGTAKYLVTFRIRQTHFTLDIGEHIKDSMNELTFDILVAKDYYDTVNVGDVISDDFRVGSLIVHGSFGNWKVTVDKKEVI